VRVLVVEDASRLRAIVAQRLREDGYAVDGAGTGEQAISLAVDCQYDAIVLDLRLPDIDGTEVCVRLRTAGCWAPILILTARDSLSDRVAGLDCGADDYLTKPFEFPELLARLRALIRRGSAERPPVLVAGDLRVDPAARSAERGGIAIELTSKEFALLEYLIRHHDVALSRERLIDAVWDNSYEGDSNIVDVYVGRLRDKIDRPFGRSTLATVWGVGYRLEGGGESRALA
jgi:two-component system OmpR family response regulator